MRAGLFSYITCGSKPNTSHPFQSPYIFREIEIQKGKASGGFYAIVRLRNEVSGGRADISISRVPGVPFAIPPPRCRGVIIQLIHPVENISVLFSSFVFLAGRSNRGGFLAFPVRPIIFSLCCLPFSFFNPGRTTRIMQKGRITVICDRHACPTQIARIFICSKICSAVLKCWSTFCAIPEESPTLF